MHFRMAIGAGALPMFSQDQRHGVGLDVIKPGWYWRYIQRRGASGEEAMHQEGRCNTSGVETRYIMRRRDKSRLYEEVQCLRVMYTYIL